MLLAETDPSYLAFDYWIDKGVMGVMLFFIVGFLAKMAWEVWKFYKPMAKEKHDSVVKLQNTLTENSGQQTEILECMKNTLAEHSSTCIHQQQMDAEAHKTACDQLKNIHHDLDKFRKEAVDPNAPFSTVKIHAVLLQACKGLRAGLAEDDVEKLRAIALENCTIIEGILE